MIIRLNADNRLELTDKAFSIRPFRELYKYYAEQLKDPDRGVAAFAILYWKWFFDSRFLLEHPTDEDAREKAAKDFVYKGDKVNCNTKAFRKAEELYRDLMDEGQTATYLIVKDNMEKMKLYAKAMVLLDEQPTEEEVETDRPAADIGIRVTFKQFKEVQDSLPGQEENLRRFRDKLIKDFQNEIDIYGGGDLGAYER